MARTAASKMAHYRSRLRTLGLRPVQLWVPDLREPAVRGRLRADAAAVRHHPSTRDGHEFTDAALADLTDWLA